MYFHLKNGWKPIQLRNIEQKTESILPLFLINMDTLDVLKIVFLAVLHTHIWFSWAKSDYYAAKAGKKILSLKRVISFLIPTIITLLSIIVVDYPVPENWFWRMSIDVVAVGIIVYFRWRLIHVEQK